MPRDRNDVHAVRIDARLPAASFNRRAARPKAVRAKRVKRAGVGPRAQLKKERAHGVRPRRNGTACSEMFRKRAAHVRLDLVGLSPARRKLHGASFLRKVTSLCDRATTSSRSFDAELKKNSAVVCPTVVRTNRNAPIVNQLNHRASEGRERAMRTERAGEAASERACGGVRGGKAPRISKINAVRK